MDEQFVESVPEAQVVEEAPAVVEAEAVPEVSVEEVPVTTETPA